MAISIVDGVQAQGNDCLADLLWETDPEIFRFIFRDLQVWRRLFPQEWTAAFGTQQAIETRVALDGNRVVGLINSFAGAEVALRFVTTMDRLLAALDAVAHSNARNVFSR